MGHNRGVSEPAAPPSESPPPRWGRRLCLGCGALLALLGLALLAGLAAEWDARPSGEAGPAAEALAARLEAAVDVAAWRRTGAVRWTFAGVNEHLWDRRRGLARVASGERRVLLRLKDQSGRAWRGETELSGAERDAALQWAWAAWCNDSFWLNPLAKLRDGGVELKRCQLEGREALLVQYGSGGVTPGDAYGWLLGEDGLPERWKMWVSIIPIPGVDATWEGWVTLETGAKIATEHRLLGGLNLALSEVAGAASLSELVSGPDPFAPLE